MAHTQNPEADAILDKEFKVLDHGFVRLVDYLGGDQRIVDAARVSYGEGTKSVRRDRELIDYLMRHRHTSPFEQVVFTFHIKMPIFVARQWIRHRTARLNEISGRYSVMRDEFYVPAPEHVHYQSKTNRMGRDESVPAPPDAAEKFREEFQEIDKAAYAHYQGMVDAGMTRELARINLPLSLYTECYWQMDLHNLLHFISLRMEPHAQLEIRKYAEVLAGIVKIVAPLAWESFERHVVKSRTFSPDEIAAIHKMIAGESPGLTGQPLIDFKEKLGLDPTEA